MNITRAVFKTLFCQVIGRYCTVQILWQYDTVLRQLLQYTIMNADSSISLPRNMHMPQILRHAMEHVCRIVVCAVEWWIPYYNGGMYDDRVDVYTYTPSVRTSKALFIYAAGECHCGIELN